MEWIKRVRDLWNGPAPKQAWDAVKSLVCVSRSKLGSRRPPKAAIQSATYAKHCQALFSRVSQCETLAEMGTFAPMEWSLNRLVSEGEIISAIADLRRGKAPGTDELCPETFKLGEHTLRCCLHRIFERLWPKDHGGEGEKVPAE